MAASHPEDLRRATLMSAGACAAVAAALVATFWVLLSPVIDSGCNTTLFPSAFKSALGPAHVLAAGVLSICICLLSAQRRGRATPGPWTVAGLSAVWIYAGSCFAVDGAFVYAALLGVFGGPLLGLPGLVALAINTLVVMRSPLSGERRWRRHAITTQLLLWGSLVIGVPASVGYAWMSGADAFCF